jgi:uncharacterized LabA/DUF88 family protein
MSFRDTIRVIQPGRRRLKIFVDFWNVVVNARNISKNIDVDVRWDRLVDQVVAETSSGHSDETAGELAGCYIFGSYSKSSPKEKTFVEHTLDEFGGKQGLYFEFKERIKKETSDLCNKCGAAIDKTSESGVDVLLTVEMVKHAAMREHDYLALISSDRDYIPLLEYLKDQGQRVLHAATDTPNREMRSLTWKQVALKPMYEHLVKTYPRESVILTAPSLTIQLEEAEAALSAMEIKYKIIDVTEESEMHDKDLKLFLSNHQLFFQMANDPLKTMHYNWNNLFSSIAKLRSSLRERRVMAHFPYVIHNGACMAYYHEPHGWIASGERGTEMRNRILKSKDSDEIFVNFKGDVG